MCGSVAGIAQLGKRAQPAQSGQTGAFNLAAYVLDQLWYQLVWDKCEKQGWSPSSGGSCSDRAFISHHQLPDG